MSLWVEQVPEEDLQRVAMATHGQIQTTVNKLDTRVLGTCERFEERQVGGERYNLFTGGAAGDYQLMHGRAGSGATIIAQRCQGTWWQGTWWELW